MRLAKARWCGMSNRVDRPIPARPVNDDYLSIKLALTIISWGRIGKIRANTGMNQLTTPGITSLRPFIMARTAFFATLLAGSELQISTPVNFIPEVDWKPVSTYPGQSAVTVTPLPLSSALIALDNESTYALLAQ